MVILNGALSSILVEVMYWSSLVFSLVSNKGEVKTCICHILTLLMTLPSKHQNVMFYLKRGRKG